MRSIMQYCSSLLKHQVIPRILAAVYLTEWNAPNMISYLMNISIYLKKLVLNR